MDQPMMLPQLAAVKTCPPAGAVYVKIYIYISLPFGHFAAMEQASKGVASKLMWHGNLKRSRLKIKLS